MKLSKNDFTDEAIDRAQSGAEDWMSWNDVGYPRTWDQEAATPDRYDCDFEAPPVAGYERLEAMGYVTRGDRMDVRGEVRVAFHITDAGRAALKDATHE